ncbi:MAG: non-heme iron oxygenase ferredoxin subunit [Actinomycetia bacterium]|nr:non-heme iron oxygenase ferredoxin subunit [Actinomycetes bacterium]
MSEFVAVCELDQLTQDRALAVVVADEPVALVLQGEEVYAIRDVCSHAEVPLSEGDVGPGPRISCWLHGSEFDLRTGEPDTPPAFEPVPVYETRIERNEADGKTIVSVRL